MRQRESGIEHDAESKLAATEEGLAGSSLRVGQS